MQLTRRSAIARCDQHDLRNEPDLTVLAVLKPANLINHLWQRYSSTALFPLASGSAPIRKELASLYSHDLVRMENKMNHLIQRSLDRELKTLFLDFERLNISQ